MGFHDRDVENNFDRMFDWDRDGKLNVFEREKQFEFEQKMIRDAEGRSDDEDDFDEDEFDEDSLDEDEDDEDSFDEEPSEDDDSDFDDDF